MNEKEKTAVYRQRIQKIQPALDIHDINLNTEGMINDVIIINQQTVFRFGKHPWAPEDLQQEGRCLTLARQYIDIPLPEWTFHAPDCVSYPLIQGVPLLRNDILSWPEPAQDALAKQLGTFLQQMHTIPSDAIKAHHIDPSATNRRPEDWFKLYEDVQKELFPILMETSKTWVHQHFAPLLADPHFMDYAPVLMNGDLSSYHLLLNPKTRLLNGIIDFGTVGTGDPACDWACLIDTYGESFVQRVARRYEGDLEAQIERARFWAGTLELQWLLGGLRNPEDPTWLGIHIGRARDVLPIGHGWPKMNKDFRDG